MADWLWVALAIALVVAVMVTITLLARRRRRTRVLRARFGDEYDRRLMEGPSRRRVESRLIDVSDQHDSLDLRPLNPTSRARYLERWQQVQGRFLDQPGHALDAGTALVAEVLRERGYPSGDAATTLDMLALDHPDAVGHFRAAHAALARTRSGLAGTEEVRVAMIQCRSLFEAVLVDASAPRPGEPQSRPGEPQSRPAEPQSRPAEPQSRPAEPQSRPAEPQPRVPQF
jgi:hypothetical protein